MVETNKQTNCRKSQQRNRRYKEPNGNLRTEKQSDQNKTQRVGSEEEGTKERTVGLNTEQEKVPDLKNREKTDLKAISQKLRGL